MASTSSSSFQRRRRAELPPSITAKSPTSITSQQYDPVREAAGLIDARFQHAVDIIQSLPKFGNISTTYEEKLMLYSLYKQGKHNYLYNQVSSLSAS